MLWAPFLHIYQPPTQYLRILREIAVECYAPLIDTFERNPKAKATINIPASLTEQLVGNGYFDLVKRLARLAGKGQIELTGSAAYHPLLTRLPDSEVERQVRLNEEINRRHLGVFKPHGFFPPEMAFSRRVGEIVSQLGYDWALIEEVTFPKRTKVRRDVVYQLVGSKLGIFFRSRDLSLALAFGKARNIDEFKGKIPKEDKYFLTAIDGETFGHHRPDAFQLLNELYKEFESVTISELFARFSDRVEVEPLECTWAASPAECRSGIAYPRWDNPKSPLHVKQWELLGLAVEAVKRAGNHGEERVLLDKAVHSDQFWWASHAPFWHPGMVKRGAMMLSKVVDSAPGVGRAERQRAKKLYDEIVTKGLKFYGRKPIVS
jgi:alpha-amylase/alpha-mannosidase (GH57 family)